MGMYRRLQAVLQVKTFGAQACNWTIPMLSGMIAEFKPPLVTAFCNLKLRVCFAPVLQAGLNQRRKIPMVEAKCQT